MNTYARMPVAFARGEGAWLFDEDDVRYLDAISGIAVCSLGHADPVLADALCDQARTLIHTANLGHIRLQEQLAETLCGIAGMDRAFITNTGAEAIESALKLARRHGHDRKWSKRERRFENKQRVDRKRGRTLDRDRERRISRTRSRRDERSHVDALAIHALGRMR